ncbi:MAG TPA: hypothetical protein PKD37_05470 [Oligoflexia bacterium]|nr:hypothetical protein [Oligoflexia bacterium]
MINFNFLVYFCLSCFLIACGSTGSDSDSAGGGDVFVPNESNTGSIKVQLNQEQIQVADTAGYTVYVRDAKGRGVPNIVVSCDSEQGVAIIEPTTGREATDSNGIMSGVIGCETPGSYLFGCRLPVGGNRRNFVTVKCLGPIPAGFDGFDGAAGGGLGGGSQGTDGSGTGQVDVENGVRLVAFKVIDLPGQDDSTEMIVDTRQDLCDETTTPPIIEKFGTNVEFVFTVINNLNQSVFFDSMRYSVAGGDADGSTFTSKKIFLLSEVETRPRTRQDVRAIAIRAIVGRKHFFDANFPIPVELGFKRVNYELFGQTADGRDFVLRGTSTINFTNINRCE